MNLGLCEEETLLLSDKESRGTLEYVSLYAVIYVRVSRPETGTIVHEVPPVRVGCQCSCRHPMHGQRDAWSTHDRLVVSIDLLQSKGQCMNAASMATYAYVEVLSSKDNAHL